eukprot:CAMPEP_0185732724 /NCGR_PEP_ID=MMETSP1171-20130828/17310_1 /TAXON_ID=374046 /ORGANISM="Helicotheca tamensis, Strain CCMP826" /LENGTH=416 /DNA_ID=CAMNT_0028402291 /DNA_START=33 /DNA_END=1283 /DNA_ORIENTATION=+
MTNIIGGGVKWAVIAAILFKVNYPKLFPHGTAHDLALEDRPTFADIDYSNESLRAKSGKLRKIYERVGDNEEKLIKGPETVVFDHEGVLYALTEESKLVSLTDLVDEPPPSIITTAKATTVLDLGPGRPLGGKIDKDGTLYFADIILGLARIKFPSLDQKGNVTTPKLEVVASRVQEKDGSWSRISFADDVDIGPKTGHIYFSDATDIIAHRKENKWDGLYPGILDALRGKKAGRLLRYKPETEEVDILAAGIWFANGVSVDKGETRVIIHETFSAKAHQYHLAGPKKGQLEVLIDGYTGYPDGMFCSHHRDRCYGTAYSTKPNAIDAIFAFPPPFDKFLRTFITALPQSITPGPKPYGGVFEIALGDDMNPAEFSRIFQDPNGQDIGFLTSATEHQGRLYLGSLENDFIGVYDLD